jgi:hypothetical protein
MLDVAANGLLLRPGQKLSWSLAGEGDRVYVPGHKTR